jgi:hypothetical protein
MTKKIPWNKGLTKHEAPQLSNSGVKKWNVPWNKGKRCPELSKRQEGKNNPNWVGDDIKYTGVHAWVRKNKPKLGVCQYCGVKTNKLDLANISKNYKRDLNDYIYLCRSCHMKMDGVNVGVKKSKQHLDKMMIHLKARKGKTYEEIYGITRAQEIKQRKMKKDDGKQTIIS